MAGHKAIALFVGALVQFGLLVVNLVITYKLAVADRGIHALIAGVFAAAGALGHFGFANAVLIRIARDGATRRYLAMSMAVLIAQCVVTAIVALLILISFPAIDEGFLIDNSLVLVALPVLLIVRVYLQSILLGMKLNAVFQSSKLLPVIILIALLLTAGDLSLSAVLSIWVVSELAVVICMACVIAFSLSVQEADDSSWLWDDLRFGARSIFGQASFLEGFKLDQITLGYLVSAQSLAVYAVAKSVSTVLRFVPQSLSQIALPMLVNAEPHRRKVVTRNLSLTAFLAGLPLIGIGYYAYQWLILPYLDALYSETLGLLLILFFSVLLFAPRRIIYEYFKSEGRPSVTSKIELAVVVAYLVLIGGLVSAGALSIFSAAIAILIVNSLALLVVLWFSGLLSH